jgi:hypothetical protein
MPAPKPTPARSRRASSPFRWATPYWLLGFGVAAILQLELVPVKAWLSEATTRVEVAGPRGPQPQAEPVAVPAPAQPRKPAPATALAMVGGDPASTFGSLHGSGRAWSALPELPRRSREERPAQVAASDDTQTDAAEPPPRRRRSTSRRRKRGERQRATAPLPPSERRSKPKRAKKKNKKRRAVARSGGKSCSAAIASYRESIVMGKNGMPADITAARYGAVLNRGTYFSHCGVPDTMRLHICAAVQNGAAVGVTVTTDPGSARVASCVAAAVRGLSFPSHPRMDVTRTTFE